MGLWTAFGPGAIMASNPGAAPLALAAITLAYFVATPFVHAVWNRFGFSQNHCLYGRRCCSKPVRFGYHTAVDGRVRAVGLFFGSGSYTLCETRMLEELAHAGQGHAFGRARKWGSFGFLAATSWGEPYFHWAVWVAP